MCREKSDVRRTEEVDSMQFFRSAKQIYQKNSSCWGISGPARSTLPQKFKISPYCLSVTLRMLVIPEGGIDLRTRRIWTSIFSLETQCRT